MIFNNWTSAEDATLHKMHEEGCDLDVMAARMPERTREAIRKRCWKLGMRNYDPRAENEQPWEPYPGMLKRRCLRCDYWFATPIEDPQPVCADCQEPMRLSTKR